MWFVSRARAFAWVIALSWLAPGVSAAAQTPVPLRGVNVVTVAASLVAPEDGRPAGLTESRLQTLAELKLRGWALKVISADEAATTPGVTPHVELEVTLLETRALQKLAGYVYFTRLAVTEPVASHTGALVNAELWSHSFLSVSDPKGVIADLERSAGELLDLFINEHLKSRR
jgi:hypothetical protein